MEHVALEDLTARIKPRMASAVLLWVIVAFFVLLALWAIFTKLDRTVHGSGRVVPTAQLQTVANLEGGLVQEIFAKPGMVVKAGDPLVRLDRTAFGADLGSSQSEFEALKVKVARLSAEVEGKTPVFPVSTNPSVNEQVLIEKSLYLSRQSELTGLLGAGNARVTQSERAVGEAQANYEAAVAARDAARQQAEILRPLVASGVEPRLSLIQAERQYSVASSQAASALAGLARARSGVAEARATVAQARQDWRAKAAEELAAAQSTIVSKRQILPAIEDRVRRTIVRAPLSGRINRVMISTVGGVVRPGEPLVEIVPADRGLTIQTRVAPADIAFVGVGQRALVKITAYDYSIYGGLEGKVIGISPDSTVEERTGETYYTLRVRTAEDHLKGAGGQRLPIGPGMIADVNLIGDKRSVLSYLFTPIARLQDTAFRER